MASTLDNMSLSRAVVAEARSMFEQMVQSNELTKLFDVNAQNLRLIRASKRRMLGKVMDAARKRYQEHLAAVSSEADQRTARAGRAFADRLWSLATSAMPTTGLTALGKEFAAALADLRAQNVGQTQASGDDVAMESSEQQAALTRKRLNDKAAALFKLGIRKAARANENAECELSRRRILSVQRVSRRTMRDELGNILEAVLKTFERCEEVLRGLLDQSGKSIDELMALGECFAAGQLLPTQFQAERLVSKTFTAERIGAIIQEVARQTVNPDAASRVLREAVAVALERAAIPDTITQALLWCEPHERASLLRDQRVLATELTPLDPDAVNPGREQRRLRVEFLAGVTTSPLVPMLDAMNVEGTERRQVEGDPCELEIVCEHRGVSLAEILEIRAAESHIGGNIPDDFWDTKPTFIRDKAALLAYRPDQPKHEAGGAHVLQMGLVFKLISRSDDQVYHAEGAAAKLLGIENGVPLGRGYDAAVAYFARNRAARDAMATLVAKKKSAFGAAGAYRELDAARLKPESIVPKAHAKQLVEAVEAEMLTLNLGHVLSEAASSPQPKPMRSAAPSTNNNGDGKDNNNEPAAPTAHGR